MAISIGISCRFPGTAGRMLRACSEILNRMSIKLVFKELLYIHKGIWNASHTLNRSQEKLPWARRQHSSFIVAFTLITFTLPSHYTFLVKKSQRYCESGFNREDCKQT